MAKKGKQTTTKPVSRRDFLKISGSSLGYCWPECRQDGWAARTRPTGPETPKIRYWHHRAHRCSSIVMAHELGLFKKYGIESVISKEASWAVIRDRLTLGENQATHMLFGMPFASTMGLLGSPKKTMIIPFVLNRNGQAITLKKELLAKGVKTPQTLKPLVDEAKNAGTPMTFAMTFPPGTHAMWTRYWLGAGGINPDKDVTLITIPPAQMVANMKVGKDGWFLRRRAMERPGYRRWHRLYGDHDAADVEGPSGKSTGVNRRVCRKESEDGEGDPAGVCWSPASTSTSWRTGRTWLRWFPARNISIRRRRLSLGRMLGDYDYGDGRKEKDPNYMTFFVRNTNFPWKSHGVWWLSQFRRWGMVKEALDYKGLVNQVLRPDILREVAKEMGIAMPKEDMKKETFFDGVEFDPGKPEEYAKKFPINNIA